MNYRASLSIGFFLTLCAFIQPAFAQKMKDYFALTSPFTYGSKAYNLSWTAHASAVYYKQEYLPAGEKSTSFTHMILMEVVTGEVSLPQAVKAKMAELDDRKKTDAVVNYQVIQNRANGEYLLDFVLSQPGNGQTDIVEWNAYRYTTLNDKSGKKGILLFAYVRRAYGAEAKNFLAALKTQRVKDVAVLSSFKIPDVKITD